ncbi:MAG: hypothetical protein AAB696_02025 [Patescibacteria group bacterium]
MIQPLYKLAQIKELPKHQFMDAETLQWIIKNKPNFDNKFITPLKFNIKFIKKIIPIDEWFSSQNRMNTIHGNRHMIRVAVYATALSNLWVKNKIQKQNITISAILHDLRRLNDRNDIEHGERTAIWFLKNYKKVEGLFQIKFSNDDKKEIYHSIYYHNSQYKNILLSKNYKKYKDAIDILKTADALDRYCQPKIKWRINDNYLFRVPPDNFKKFAYKLVIKSEKMIFKGIKGIDCVFIPLKIYNETGSI